MSSFTYCLWMISCHNNRSEQLSQGTCAVFTICLFVESLLTSDLAIGFKVDM